MQPYIQLMIRTGQMGTQMNSLREAFDECFKANDITDLECDLCNLANASGTKVRRPPPPCRLTAARATMCRRRGSTRRRSSSSRGCPRSSSSS
jgi:hypothetical protein